MSGEKLKIVRTSFGDLGLGSTGQEHNIVASLVNNIAIELQRKKDQIIIAKFEEKGFSHLLATIENKRFKRILIERHPDCEKWFADNGTDEGVLIVTFLNPSQQLPDVFDKEFKIITEIEYY